MSKHVFNFEPAARKKMLARIAISGVSGAGKTFTALSLAEGFAGPNGNIAVIDSQFGQSRLYSDKFTFRVLELDDHSPSTYTAAIKAAEQQGFDVIIVDSLSRAWSAQGGALELVDKAAKKFGSNSYAGWSEVTPLQNKMMDAVQGCKAHIIVTLQSKMDYVLEPQSNGKTKPVAVGMGVVQRDGVEYALDLEIYMDRNHTAEIIKTRYSELDGMIIEKPDKELAAFISEQLDLGEEAPDEHWSNSFKKRSYLLNQLDKDAIPHESLFACFGVNNWSEMKAVTLPDGGSKALIQKVAEYYADNG